MFADGNKRTSVEMIKSFANKSGIKLKLNDTELMDVATKVATNELNDVSDIATTLTK